MVVDACTRSESASGVHCAAERAEGVGNVPAHGTEFDISRHLSAEARRRQPGQLVQIVTQFVGVEGVIGMHGGLPPAAAFPLTGLILTLPDPRTGDPATVPVTDPAALATMQQYNLDKRGFAPLRAWLSQHVAALHRPARPDTDIVLTSGTSATIDLLLRTLCDAGDAVLVEEYLFSQVLEGVLRPLGLRPIGVAMDGEGILPEALRAAIQGAPRPPRVLYVVPHGQNPTGAVMSARRKAAIYAVCSAHDVAIVEDDPYIYLQFANDALDVPGLDVEPGFLHHDTDGRVIRVDTFSKCLAPGTRLGWLSAAPAVAEAFAAVNTPVTMGPAGPSQMMVHAMLSHWGHDGFEAHVRRTQRRYKEQAAALQEALREHCAGLAVWQPPQAGMFLWLQVPGVVDATDLMDRLVDHKVVIVPGRIFHVDSDDPSFKCNYFRIAFSSCSAEELREGARRLGGVLHSLQ